MAHGGSIKGLHVLAVVAALICCVSGLAVMSVDLGGEFMKIAIVKPGVPMEIVLNKESSRKTSTVVAFRDGERQFGNTALNTALKFPPKAFIYLNKIIGKSFDDPQVKLYQEKFPFYNLVKDEERGTVLFKIDEKTSYSPEELMGMILEKAKDYAETFAGQKIKDCVITVPAFYTQAERRAVLAAANMVGINVLQLMSDNAAVALNYGVFRYKMFNTTTQYYMFYDMGSTSTTVTIVGYNTVENKVPGQVKETHPQLTIKGVGFDRNLGGLEFTLNLRAHLAKAFNGQKKTKKQVESNNRAMAKLLKEAERVKKVLSANSDHNAQVENLLDEKDFKQMVKREEFEKMNEALFAKVTKPIEDALKVSEITLPEISEVILMGGATRTPKVQELLKKFLGRDELGKSINTDEAAALGAVYQSAYLGKGFKVKTFGVREGNIYPINVEFQKQKTEDSDKPKTIKRTLFSRMNPFPQKKVMTFNRHSKDFSFNVLYSSLDFLSDADKQAFSNPVISRYDLKGVEDAIEKNKLKAEPKGIKAHFRMDESGLLTLDRVESLFEKNASAEAAEKSTWSKLGSAIGGLFGGSSDEGDSKVEDGATDDSAGAGTATGEGESAGTGTSAGTGSEGQEEGKPQEDTAEEKPKKDEAPDADAKKEEKKTDEGAKKEEGEKKDDSKKKEKKKEEPKVVNVKEIIYTEKHVMDLKDLTSDNLKVSEEKLKELRDADIEKEELQKAKNELEAYCFDLSDKLNNGLHAQAATAEEKEKLLKSLSAASDWLYEQPDDAKKTVFMDKLSELKKETNEIQGRVQELIERPKALDALKYTLNQTSHFLGTVKNMSDEKDDDPIFTKVEVATLEKLITDTKKWRDESLVEQNKLAAHQAPTMPAKTIVEKVQALEREMQYMINKAKNFVPKAKKSNATDSTKDNKTEEKTTEEKTTEEEVKEDSESEKTTEDKTEANSESKDTPTQESPQSDTTTETEQAEQQGGQAKQEEGQEQQTMTMGAGGGAAGGEGANTEPMVTKTMSLEDMKAAGYQVDVLGPDDPVPGETEKTSTTAETVTVGDKAQPQMTATATETFTIGDGDSVQIGGEPEKKEKPATIEDGESVQIGGEPVKKEEPAKPAEAEKPKEAAKPAETAKPAEAEKPVEAAKPAKEEKPAEPAKPAEAEKVTKSEKTAEQKSGDKKHVEL